MDWMPNEDGILWFCREILPRIRRQSGNVSFVIVGRSPSAIVQALSRENPDVAVTGRVEDVRPYLNEASVYVVPLRSGSGTRLKIFEAMAAGKAVVSTGLGAEGLPVVHDRDLLLADETDSFADAVVSLLRDPERRCSLGQSGHRLVERNHGWPAVAAHFEAILEDVRRLYTGAPARSAMAAVGA
jgi:glycosyltransferase involved in cell wall biosynthesis